MLSSRPSFQFRTSPMDIVDDISDAAESAWTAPELSTSAIPWYLRPHMSVSARLRRTKKQRPKLEKGIYGCQKRCLYALVIIAIAASLINLSLLVWIAHCVLDLPHNPLHVVEGGINVLGDAEFDYALSGWKIKPKRDENVRVESSRKIIIAATKIGQRPNTLVVGNGEVSFRNKFFRVYNKKRKCVFETGQGSVGYNISGLVFDDEGGSEIKGSLVSELVRSPSQLRLESPRRRIDVTGPEGVDINSKAGQIGITCADAVSVRAKKGTITLDSQDLRLKGLEAAEGQSSSTEGVFDVCICDNGRIFLANPNGLCQAGGWVCKD